MEQAITTNNAGAPILEHRFAHACNPSMEAFTETINKLIKFGFRFTVIHNPDEKRLNIISVTNPDKIKSKFPDFNIFLSARNEKMVERIFFYE